MEKHTQAHGGHRARLRQKVRDVGLDAMEPHEIIEFLLYYTVPRQDVNALAHRLIERYGSVGAVLAAEVPDLMRTEGLGGRSAEFLAWVGELAAVSARLGDEDRFPITNYAGAFRYACELSRRYPPPCCVQLCLDRGSRLLYQRALCPSRAWGEPATLLDALDDVLSTGARNVILIEFVGAQSIEPEEYDLNHVRAYADALHAAESALLDLLIVGVSGTVSLRRLGRIPDLDFSPRARSVREDYLRADADDALHSWNLTTNEEDE